MAQFISNLPVGTLVKFGAHQVNTETAQPIVWIVADKNHSGYPSNSVTLIAQKSIDIRTYDEIEVDNDDRVWSSANYGLSNIHQWLNASLASGWFSYAHDTDVPPNYASRPGFLYNFTEEERLALLPTTLTTQTGDNVSSSIVARVFLPSMWEILGTHIYADGSTRFAYFGSADVKSTITSQAYNNTTASAKPSTVASYWHYMTRSTVSNRLVVAVSESATSVNRSSFESTMGVRPVINLSTNIKVSDTVDSDGCYTVAFNKAPVISGTNSNLGKKVSGFTQTYTVTDADSDPVTVKEYIDNVLVRSYVATLGATNTISITGATWLKLANGVHTIKIVATDGFVEVTRTFTFTKSVTTLVVQRATPLDSDTQPKSIIVTVVKVIPEGAIFKVEACNNGYDASPTWEDITNRVLSGRIYDFANTTKTASKWGVNVRVTVDRNGKEGACYITEIGGNFE